MPTRQDALSLSASTPEAGAVASKLRTWDAKGVDILPMHLRSAFAKRNQFYKEHGQLPFNALLLNSSLFYSLFFRIRSLSEQANERPKNRGITMMKT